MLVRRYLKYFSALLATFLVSERIPLIKTIDPSSSEASQLLSALSELANGAKENIVEMAAWPSDFFHWNEDDQTPKVHEFPPPSSPSPPPLEHPPEPLPEPLQSSEPPQSPEPPQYPEPLKSPEPLQSPEPTPPMADSTSRFLTVDGSKVILVLDMEMVPGFPMARKVAYWFGSGFGQSYWSLLLVSAALGFFGGLGYGLVGWCRWWLSTREALQAVETDVFPQKTERKTPASMYFEALLRQSYMMPLTFPDLRRLRAPAQTAATKSEHAEEINAMLDGIVKKEEDADPLMVPPSLSDPSWYTPASPTSTMQSDEKGLVLSFYDGFQPKPQVSRPNDLPETLLGSLSLTSSSPRPQEPERLRISDPWSDYALDNQAERS